MNQPPSGSTSPRMKTIRSCQPAGWDADPGLRAPYAAPGRVYLLGEATRRGARRWLGTLFVAVPGTAFVFMRTAGASSTAPAWWKATGALALRGAS